MVNSLEVLTPQSEPLTRRVNIMREAIAIMLEKQESTRGHLLLDTSIQEYQHQTLRPDDCKYFLSYFAVHQYFANSQEMLKCIKREMEEGPNRIALKEYLFLVQELREKLDSQILAQEQHEELNSEILDNNRLTLHDMNKYIGCCLKFLLFIKWFMTYMPQLTKSDQVQRILAEFYVNNEKMREARAPYEEEEDDELQDGAYSERLEANERMVINFLNFTQYSTAFPLATQGCNGIDRENFDEAQNLFYKINVEKGKLIELDPSLSTISSENEVQDSQASDEELMDLLLSF